MGTSEQQQYKSIKILVDCLIQAYGEGKKEAGKVAAKVEEKRVSDEKKKQDDEILAKDLIEEVAAVEDIVEKKAVKEAERIIQS